MDYFILPSVIALIIKLYIILAAHKSKHGINFFVPLVIVFGLHNLCEFLLYVLYYQGIYSLQLFKVYYSITFVMAGFIVVYALKISEIKFNYVLKNIIYIACTSLALYAFSSDSVISGVEDIGYSLTATKGHNYLLFQYLIPVFLLFSLCLMLYGFRKHKEYSKKAACLISTFALLPIILTIILVILIMTFGVKINASGLLPLSTSLFLFILIKFEAQHQLIDVRRFIPFSPERQLSNEFMKVSSLYSTNQINYKSFCEEVQKISLKYKLDQNNGNVSQTSRSMGMHRSTVNSMIKRHKIK